MSEIIDAEPIHDSITVGSGTNILLQHRVFVQVGYDSINPKSDMASVLGRQGGIHQN
jgi:hypothetical protein